MRSSLIDFDGGGNRTGRDASAHYRGEAGKYSRMGIEGLCGFTDCVLVLQDPRPRRLNEIIGA